MVNYKIDICVVIYITSHLNYIDITLKCVCSDNNKQNHTKKIYTQIRIDTYTYSNFSIFRSS